jgi:hypothetical protein
VSPAPPAERRRLVARLLALLGLLASGALAAAVACSAARPQPCPGDPVATFLFHADPVVPAGCPFPSDAGLDFTATVSYTSETTAVLCVERPEAQPLPGTRAGDHLTLAGAATPATAPPCACAVDLVESLEGDVERADGGVTGFTGELRDALAPADGGAPADCEPRNATATRCGIPCQLTWRLTGAR